MVIAEAGMATANEFSLVSVKVALSPRERFDEFLQARGKRITKQRRIIVEQVYRRHEHFDAEQLLDLIRNTPDGEREFFYWRKEAPARELFSSQEAADQLCQKLVHCNCVYLRTDMNLTTNPDPKKTPLKKNIIIFMIKLLFGDYI